MPYHPVFNDFRPEAVQKRSVQTHYYQAMALEQPLQRVRECTLCESIAQASRNRLCSSNVPDFRLKRLAVLCLYQTSGKVDTQPLGFIQMSCRNAFEHFCNLLAKILFFCGISIKSNIFSIVCYTVPIFYKGLEGLFRAALPPAVYSRPSVSEPL